MAGIVTYDEQGNVVQTVQRPELPPEPVLFSKNEFLAWFDAEFGANATPTKAQLSSAWPVQ